MIQIDKITDAKKHLNGIAAAIFDLDDTLYPEKDYVKSGYKAIAESMPEVENMAEKLWTAFENGASAIDYVLQSEGVFSEEKKAECLRIYRYHMPDIQLYEGVLEMLCELREKGVQLGIITDGRSEGQRAKIDALELWELFDKIIITDELGGTEYRKPNEKAFVIMQQHFSVGFEEMAYIGDNPKKDFTAPVRLGMRAVHFVNTDGLYNK